MTRNAEAISEVIDNLRLVLQAVKALGNPHPLEAG